MTDENGDKDRKKQSLLSLGGAAADTDAPRGGGSILSAARAARDDAAKRHRMARSRREAAPSPLLSALAAMEGYRPEPTVEHSAEARKSRWSLSELLSPKVKPTPPPAVPGTARAAEPEPAAVAAPADREVLQQPAAEERPVPADTFVDEAVADESPDNSNWQPLIDPLRVIGGVGSSKALIAATTVLGAALGVMVALSTPKKYESYAELLVDPRDLKFSDRDLTQTGLPSDATLALVENQVRVMTSGTVLNKVVDKLKLDKDPEFNGQRSAGGIGNVIASLRALLSAKPGGGSGDITRALAVSTLAESLTVERAGKTFIITIGAKTEEPEKSALIANTVTEAYLQTYGELQSGTAGRAADELTAGLEKLRVDLEEAERKTEKFRAENDLIDAQGRLISDDELVKLNDQLAIARAHTIELNAKAASLRSIKVDSIIGGGLPEEATSPVMSELRSQYAAMKQQADQLSVRLGPRHPQYLAMQAQLSGAREQIADELRRIAASVQTDLKRAVQQEQDLAARLAQLKVRSTDVNAALVTLRQLEREAAAKRSIYENSLLRAKEATERRDLNTANISIISQAYPPIESTGPSRATIVMGFVLLGFLGGVGIGIGRGILSSILEKGRVRRRGRRPSPRAAATAELEGAPLQAADPAPASAGVEALADDTTEPTMSPLARLMERMRWPSRPTSLDEHGVEVKAAPIDIASSPLDPQTGTPAADGHATQEAPTMDATMYPYPQQQPVYPQQQQPVYPQTGYHPQPQPAPYAPQPAPYAPQPYPSAFAQPVQYPPQFAPQPQAAYPYPPVAQPQPAFHGWPQQPAPAAPYGYPQQPMPYPAYAAAPQPAFAAAAQPAFYPQETRQAAPELRPVPAAAREMSPIEEVRESLREFREAIRDLAEDRRKRYS